MSLYEHVPHPRIAERLRHGPVKTADQHADGVSGRVALRLTAVVGTMGMAYGFALLALLALPAVLGFNWLPARTLLIVGWVSQTFIQLVMLAVLQLGQNISGAAADKRAESTYSDAEAILHTSLQLQEHLAAQDTELSRQTAALVVLMAAFTPPPPPAGALVPIPGGGPLPEDSMSEKAGGV